jgi:hypothetical protein
VFTGIPEGEGHDPGEFYAAAIYGSILAVAFITIFRQEHAAPEAVAVSVLGTMVVFFVAHVWSSILGWRLHHRQRVTFGRVKRIGRAEWPLLEAGVAPGLVLVLGWIGVISPTHAEDIALAVCIIQLFAWGFVVGLRTYDLLWAALLGGFVDGALGLVIVALEIRVVH